MAAFLTEWLPTQLISCRCSRLYLAIQSDPICWNAKKLKEKIYFAKYFTTACILCCITNHNRAFPISITVQCSNTDEKCKPAHWIQFDQISEIQSRDLIFAQHLLFVSLDVWAKRFCRVVRFFGTLSNILENNPS